MNGFALGHPLVRFCCWGANWTNIVVKSHMVDELQHCDVIYYCQIVVSGVFYKLQKPSTLLRVLIDFYIVRTRDS